jgi:hypothetical protein
MAHLVRAVQQKKVGVDFADKAHWPHFTDEERITVYRKCGQPCFAKPIQAPTEGILANPKETLQFPVCRPPAPRTRKCKISASGLLAASRRARLTKKYPEIVESTTQLIRKMGTTGVALRDMKIKRVRVNEVPLPDGKHLITIVYANGVQKETPYTKRHILRKYGNYLSKALHQRLLA